jgi:hypothetical protein
VEPEMARQILATIENPDETSKQHTKSHEQHLQIHQDEQNISSLERRDGASRPQLYF